MAWMKSSESGSSVEDLVKERRFGPGERRGERGGRLGSGQHVISKTRQRSLWVDVDGDIDVDWSGKGLVGLWMLDWSLESSSRRASSSPSAHSWIKSASASMMWRLLVDDGTSVRVKVLRFGSIDGFSLPGCRSRAAILCCLC